MCYLYEKVGIKLGRIEIARERKEREKAKIDKKTSRRRWATTVWGK